MCLGVQGRRTVSGKGERRKWQRQTDNTNGEKEVEKVKKKKITGARKSNTFLIEPDQEPFISKSCIGFLVLQPVVSLEGSPYSGQD